MVSRTGEWDLISHELKDCILSLVGCEKILGFSKTRKILPRFVEISYTIIVRYD